MFPPMLHPRAVHHLAIKVCDLALADAFYTRILGLTVLRRWPAEAGEGDRSLWLDLGGGAFLALERGTHARTPLAEEDSGLHLLALCIGRTERQAWIDRLAAAGVTPYRQTDFTIYFMDPEGNRIGLSHWPDSA